ncbi:ATP-dependent zinc metalloprotease FtsH [Chrysiogenes arsenatis]|uniref:ATP-dependent zinc metalloprotease FtsH n=1 Tax=Chrysiogenes arsenatis TaxID=309797 RepID=UPI003CCD7D31
MFNTFNVQTTNTGNVPYSQFIGMVERGSIAEVQIQGDTIIGRDVEGRRIQTVAPNDPDMISTFKERGIQIDVRQPEGTPWYLQVLISWFPMLLLIGVWIFFMRQMQMGGNKAMSFGKSKAKMLSESDTKVTFNDVAGVEEAKEELVEIVDFLKDPKKFTKLGGKIPKGVLLMGSPGTGKTLLARAIAGEAGVPFFSISGSDFVEMFVGVGASRVRDLFEQGKKNAPCIIFIDEIDAVGRHRGAGLGGGHDEREQTLNQLLVEMDGFESNEGVILIAATNRPDVLDPALQRPGRFDRQVIVPKPDMKGRLGILKVHTSKIPLAPNVVLDTIARGTPGFSGADLSNLCNEAALIAARRNRIRVEMVDFEEAKDKVSMGPERRSMVLSEEERRNTAYHEAGHAIVGKFLKGTDPVHKVTIIPRGRALGVTMYLPQDDKFTHDAQYLENQIAMLMGGRIAEELVMKHKTTGAGNDIERATEIARRMVCEWGMSDEMGPLVYGQKQEEIFLGREITQHKNYSETTARSVDSEIQKFVMRNYENAKAILTTNIEILHEVAKKLLEEETIDGKAIDDIIRNHYPDYVPHTTSKPIDVVEASEVKVTADTNTVQPPEQPNTNNEPQDGTSPESDPASSNTPTRE